MQHGGQVLASTTRGQSSPSLPCPMGHKSSLGGRKVAHALGSAHPGHTLLHNADLVSEPRSRSHPGERGNEDRAVKEIMTEK